MGGYPLTLTVCNYSMKIVELSHLIDKDISVYPGFPKPKIETYLSHEDSRGHYDGQAEFHINKVEFVASIGTYIDSPYHRHKNGRMISDVPIYELLDIPTVVVDHDVEDGRGVRLGELDVAGKAVLFRTGWSRKWKTDSYYVDPPFLSDETVDYLVSQKPSLVGVDFGNVDYTGNLVRPAHTRLLGEGVFIVESLTNLGAIPSHGFTFNAIPTPFKGLSTSPIRAFAKIP